MRRAAVTGFIAIVMACSAISTAARAGMQGPEDSLRIYAVNVVKTPPFKPPFVGFGVYLGKGAVLSAAHVVGRWPLFTRPRVLVAGQDIPATVLKMGSSDGLDVALLRIDETRLPIAMRLRRNPLCRTPPVPGEEVFAVIPDKVVLTRILSPAYINPGLRAGFGTLIEEVATPSGSGIFRARSKCLLGIMSKAVPKLVFRGETDDDPEPQRQLAGYFVPAALIYDFLLPEFRF